MKQLLFYVSTLCLISCQRTDTVKYFYYSTGEIKEKMVFSDMDKPNDFLLLSYSKEGWLTGRASIKNKMLNGNAYLYHNDGTLQEIKHYVNNKKNGKVFEYDIQNKLLNERIYLNDTLHGIVRIYEEFKEPKEQNLFIMGKQITRKLLSKNKDKSLIKFEDFIISSNDSLRKKGQLVTDVTTNSYLEELSFSYVTSSSDTVRAISDSIEIKVDLITKYSWNLELHIGELNKDLAFKNAPKIFKGRNNQLNFKIAPKKRGDNLLVGKLFTTLDSVINGSKIKLDEELIFYHEFYVK